MEIKSPPRLVSLDTQVFEKLNYHFDSQVFRALVELTKKRKVRLLLTSVILNEIKEHIAEGAELASKAVEEAVNNLDRNRRKPKENERRIRISANSDLLYEFTKRIRDIAPNSEQINRELLNKFNVFLQETNSEMIEVNQVSVAKILQDYFSSTPPFGKGKKKHEFPDAFALLALQKEAENRNRIIYVVSDDSDWKDFCSLSEDLFSIGTLQELLETINRETNLDEVDACYELYNRKKDEIKRYIENEFADLDSSIDLSGTSIIDWGSEEIEVKVNLVDIINSSLVRIDDSIVDQPLVSFELEAEVNYEANVSYKSLEFAIYDREDDEYYGGETINEVFTQSSKLNVEVTLILSRDKDYSLCDANIEDITIDPNNTLGEIVIDTGFRDDYY